MRILIVEDDKELSNVIQHQLEKHGYMADVCHNGGDALHFIKQQAYQLIILDRLLPEVNGIDILTKMRALNIKTPVIITTALDGIADRITGLDAGADDYLVKPFSLEELMARIRAISRRPVQLDIQNVLTFADLTLHLATLTLSSHDTTFTLSKKEAELLEVFMRNPKQVLTRQVLLARVWGPDAPIEDGNLDNYIHFLRRRLKTVDSQTKIRTIRSVGYILEEASC